MLKTNKDIELALRDYHLMVREVARLEKELNTVEGITATGIGDTRGRTGDIYNPVLNEVIRRDEKNEILDKFNGKIDFINKYATCITNDRELIVLNCLLDGLNINMISQHMGYSKRTIYMIKESLVQKIKEFAESDMKEAVE